jgi:alkylated DNA repair dioxygenase AlkB
MEDRHAKENPDAKPCSQRRESQTKFRTCSRHSKPRRATPYTGHPNSSTKIALSEQFNLFAQEPVQESVQAPQRPEGLRYRQDFIPAATEQALIEQIAALPLQPFQFGPYEGKRRVASFGVRYDHGERKLQQADSIPDWLAPVIEDVEAFGGPATRIGQVLCTEYDIGVGIGWHRDRPHYDRVFGLSLGAACKFRFRRPVGASWERFTLGAQPRSIYLMSGPSRTVWEHSIPPVEARRYSITLRTLAAKS